HLARAARGPRARPRARGRLLERQRARRLPRAAPARLPADRRPAPRAPARTVRRIEAAGGGALPGVDGRDRRSHRLPAAARRVRRRRLCARPGAARDRPRVRVGAGVGVRGLPRRERRGRGRAVLAPLPGPRARDPPAVRRRHRLGHALAGARRAPPARRRVARRPRVRARAAAGASRHGEDAHDPRLAAGRALAGPGGGYYSAGSVTGLIIGVAVGAVLLVALLLLSVRVVREYQRNVVFRLGRCIGTKGPGIIFLIPIIDRPVLVDLREQYLEIPQQTGITKDNAPISIDFIVFHRVVDAV